VSEAHALAVATGYALSGVGVSANLRPTLQDLQTILSAHPLLHGAEGDLYRDVLVDACHARGLDVTVTHPKQAYAVAATVLGCDAAALDALMQAFGRSVGPPWRQDHKLATLAALVALHG
jgi:hypothetical protein